MQRYRVGEVNKITGWVKSAEDKDAGKTEGGEGPDEFEGTGSGKGRVEKTEAAAWRGQVRFKDGRRP